MRRFSQKVPLLGEVQLRYITLSDYETICQRVEQVEVSQRAETFSNLVFKTLLVDQDLAQRVTALSEVSLEALVMAAADSLGYREQVESDTGMNLPLTERLYAAHLAAVRDSQERWEKMQRRMDELEAAFPEIREALKEADFWIPLSAPFRLTVYLEAHVKEGTATPENVTALIVERFRRNDFHTLKRMVEDWYAIPYFYDRKDIIKDALEAHTNGRYTLSIPALLPLAEGFLRSKRGAPQYSGLGRWMAGQIKRTPERDTGIINMDVGALAPYIENEVYLVIPWLEQTPEKYAKWIQGKGSSNKFKKLHRHGILHGLQADYATEENSLRAFFLIASLASLELDES